MSLSTSQNYYLGSNGKTIGKNVSQRILGGRSGTHKNGAGGSGSGVLKEVKSNLHSLISHYDKNAQKNNDKINMMNAEIKRLQQERAQMNEALKKYQEYSKTLENEYKRQHNLISTIKKII